MPDIQCTQMGVFVQKVTGTKIGFLNVATVVNYLRNAKEILIEILKVMFIGLIASLIIKVMASGRMGNFSLVEGLRFDLVIRRVCAHSNWS